jgi:spore coat protein CotH
MNIILALFLVVATATTALAQQAQTLLGPTSADPLFDGSVLHDVLLTVNSSDWQTLKDHYLEDTYYPADFRWRSNVVRNVGIKSRGTGSRSGTKPGLKVDFAHYTSDQNFLGLKSIVLRNNTQDPSNMRERIGMLLFVRMGLPASRESHARLFINGEYSGLYTIVEPLDKAFLRHTWGSDAGYLYSYEYPADAAPYYFDYRGDAPAAYVPVPFTPETHESDPRADFIVRWVQAINLTGESTFRTVMAQFVDLERLLRHVAIEAYLGDDDGFLGNWGMDNFYTYRFPDSSTFTILPWDKSDAFIAGPYASVWHNILDVPPAQQNRLMTRAMRYADLYASWLNALDECVRTTTSPGTNPPGAFGWLAQEIETEYRQIQAAALADPVKPFTNDQFEQAVNDLRDFAVNRGGFVSAEVSAARARAGLTRTRSVR